MANLRGSVSVSLRWAGRRTHRGDVTARRIEAGDQSGCDRSNGRKLGYDSI